MVSFTRAQCDGWVHAIHTSTGTLLAEAAGALTKSLAAAFKAETDSQAQRSAAQELAIEAGALEALLAALAREREHVAAQRACIAVLAFLSSAQPAFGARACAGGAVELVVHALRTHRKLAVVCCGALFTLLGPPERDNESLAVAARAGAVAAVFDALRAAPTDARLQVSGFRALFALSRLSPTRKEVVAAGGVEYAVSALTAHMGVALVVACAADFLSNVCGYAGEHESDARATAAGAVAAVVRAARLHAAELDVQSAAAEAIMRMATTPADAARADAVALMVAASRTHAADSARLVKFFTAIARLQYRSPASARAACAASAVGLPEAVAAALCTHAADGECVFVACAALLRLIENDEQRFTADSVACGVPALVLRAQHMVRPDRQPLIARLSEVLQVAERLHDTRRCERCERCCRCAAAREAAEMCGLPRCGLRRREDGRKLQRCAGCRVAVFCSDAHQREAWPAHKAACKAARAQTAD